MVLLSLLTITMTYAWVNNNNKSKITAEQVIVSESDSLLISINELTYKASINANDANESNYAQILSQLSLKDYTGDGVNLYSPTVDPYTKKPLANGWSIIRTDTGDPDAIEALNAKSENKTYLSMKIDFKANKPLEIYLSPASYCLPADSGKTASQCLFLKRVASYDIETEAITYKYYTEDGELKNADPDNLPKVYNQSLYCTGFDDSIDQAVFLAGPKGSETTIESVQTIYSANYVCSTVRFAFLDETKTGNYLTVFENSKSEDETVRAGAYGTDGHVNFDNCKLRMVWAPNARFHGNDETDQLSASFHKYSFDIVDVNERTLDSQNGYYLCDNTSLTQTPLLHYPNDLFVMDDLDTEELISNYKNTWNDAQRATNTKPHKLVTLTEDAKGQYVGSITVVMWLEGTDQDAMVALTGGDASSTGGDASGTAKIKFKLSFFGQEIVVPTSGN